MKKINNIVLIDFTGVYREQEFYKKEEADWVDVRELSGCSCYCDEEAETALEKLLQSFPPEGIHFLDSGNYHYMSLFWLRKIQEPFRLLVFDNHTDMQPPAFGGILSCGGWIAAALEELSCLKELVLVGPDQAAFDQTAPSLGKKVRFLSRETLVSMQEPDRLEFFHNISPELPLYISVDKDVLSPEDASTAWSQGDMHLDELETCLGAAAAGKRVIGIDVCGECDLTGDHILNDRGNGMLLDFWKDWRKSHEK